MVMDAVFRMVDRYILDKMGEGKLPGLSLAIVSGDEVIYSRGYGFMDISRAAPAKEETLYSTGSITKSFTALSIMQLVEKGKLSLRDPVGKYLDIVPGVFRDGVNIHHLLTHSSGLPALGYAEAYIRGLVGLDDIWLPINKPMDVVAFMDEADGWREAQPGERFFYLNEGYVLLGLIIEKVSGLSYEEYVRKNILEPLGMDRTYFDPDDISRDGGLAKPYIIDESGKIVESRFPYGVFADGGLVSNVLDLARYITMYINKGIYNGRRIVGWDSIRVMETPYIKLPYEIFGGEAYGYGLMITPDFYGYKLVSHSGSVLVHTGYIGYIRDEELGVALLANGAGYRLSFIGQYILTLMLGEDPKKLPFIWNDEILKGFEGNYQLYKGTVKARVEKRGSLLYIIMREGAGEIEIPLFPEELGEDYSVFRTVSNWRTYRVEFRKRDGYTEFIFERYKYRKF